MKLSHRLRFFVVVLLWIWDGSAALAYDLPPVNLGVTSFLDGGPPAGGGLYYSPMVQFYTTDSFRNDSGDDFLLPTAQGPRRHDLDVIALLNQLIYLSDFDGLPGSKWGLDLIVPVVGFGLDPNDSLALNANDFGVGDIVVGPFLQWEPIMRTMGPFFVQRIEFQFILPSGKYDRDHEINPGSNIFSFNPYWAATLFPTDRWTLSWRFHYLWNSTNSDPSRRTQMALAGVGGDPNSVSSIQPGQAVHLNFTSAYMVIPDTLRIGVNGYYLKQITDTRVNGGSFPGRREEVLGIGPGAVLHLSRDTHLFLNAYFEVHAENRTKGERVTLRLIQHF
ncbi:MAG: SphA family protein [Gammaproteobacteria bacterium]